MLWGVEFEGELTVQKIVNAIVELLKKIFGFIADEEGWKEEEEVVA